MVRSIVMVCVVLGSTAALRANTAEEALGKMADDIKKYANSKEIHDVRIEGFRGVGEFSTSAGSFLVDHLIRMLKQREMEVKIKARLIISGEYEEVEDPETQVQAVRIEITIKDREEDKKIPIVRRFVKNQTEISRILGLTVEFPPDAGKTDRNDELKKQIDKPKPVIRDSVLRASPDSKFAIEILVKQGERYVPRTPEDKDHSGLAFVGISREEVYAVRLINDNTFDVAVALTLDGLSMFIDCEKEDPKSHRPLRDPKTGKPLFQHVIVPAGKSVPIRGWFINLEKSDEFKVTSYTESLANLFKSTGNIGTITATFHAAVAPNTELPPGEPKGDQFSQANDATGRGKRFDEPYGVKELKFGGLRATISVRYTR